MKLHLPPVLRTALIAVCAAATLPATTMAENIVENSGYSYYIEKVKVNDTYKLVERPVSFSLDGNNRQDSYTANLNDSKYWVKSGDALSTIRFTNLADILISNSTQYIDGAQMTGLNTNNSIVDRYSKLDLTVSNSKSFTFRDHFAGDKAALTYTGTAEFDNVDTITFSNITGHLVNDAGFSITNAKKVTFSGITGSIYYNYYNYTEGRVNFTDIGELRFENNKAPFFNATRSGYLPVFARIDKWVVTGNTSSGSFFQSCCDTGTRLMYFDNIASVEITDNRIGGTYMFSNEYMPVFRNCDSISISNNTAVSSTLISRELAIYNASKGVYINNNNIQRSSNGAILTSGNRISFQDAGDINVIGEENRWISMLQINNNTGTGTVSGGLIYGFLNAMYVSEVQVNNNTLTSTNGIEDFLLGLQMSDVGKVSVDNNVLTSDKRVFFGGGHELVDFASLSVSGNKLTSTNSYTSLGSTWMLLGKEDKTSTVRFNNNVLKGADMFHDATFHVDCLSKMEISGNNITNVYGFMGYMDASDIKDLTISDNVTNVDLGIDYNFDGVLRGGVFHGNSTMDGGDGHGAIFEDVGNFTVSGNRLYHDGKAAGGVFGTGLIANRIKNFVATDNVIAAGVNADGSYKYARVAAGALANCYYSGFCKQISFTDSSVKISRNAVYGDSIAYGGAMGCTYYSLPLDVINSDIVFTDNHAYAGMTAGTINSDGDVRKADGGAIRATIHFDNDGRVEFSGNTAEGYTAFGGAASLNGDSFITADTVVLKDNKVVGVEKAQGGAFSSRPLSVYNSRQYLFGNSHSIVITGNSAQASSLDKARGGALFLDYSMDSNKIATFYCNDSVYIRGNYITDGNRVQLQAIASDGPTLFIQTKAGQSFECYDGIQTAHTLYINGNDDYTAGVWNEDEILFKGTVKFSGEYAAKDLAALNPKYTKEDLLASRTIHADKVIVDDGTLVLDNVRVETGMDSLTYSVDVRNSSFLTQRTSAQVHMHNATIASRIDFLAADRLYHGLVTIMSGTFSGANTIEATRLWATSGTWNFNLTSENKSNPLLTVVFDPEGDGGIAMVNQTIKINAAKGMAKGTYKLVTYDTRLGEWQYQNLYFIGPDGSSLTLGSSDLYAKVDKSILTLYYNFGGNFGRGNTTLTWVGSYGTWAENSGATVGTWKASVKDLNFYAGDKVVFNAPAEITVKDRVEPASILVSNTKGTVLFSSATDGGEISGSASLTKEGAGRLELNLANSYTGATTVKAGTLYLGNVNALGGSQVTLSGGTLDLHSLAVSNGITATGGALTGADAYTGHLTIAGSPVLDGTVKANLITVKSGTLSGGTIQDSTVEALGGTLNTPIAGTSALTSSGTVTLNGTQNYSGATTVSGGTLTISGQLTNSNVTVLSGGKLKVPGSVNQTIALNGGTLEAGGTGFTIAPSRTLSLSKGTVTGNLTTGTNARLLMAGDSKVSGNLTLNGGTVDFRNGTLTVGGKLVLNAPTTIDIQNMELINASALLFKFGSLAGDLGSITINSGSSASYELYNAGKELYVFETGSPTTLRWNSGNGTWERLGSRLWTVIGGSPRNRFFTGDNVLFSSKGTVTINNFVTPSSVEVSGTAAVTFSGKGGIAGTGVLTKNGSGTLTMNSVNLYKGGTVINGGTVKVTGVDSLGTGAVTLNSGKLDLNKKAVANNITAKGGTLANATTYAGNLTVDGNVTLGSGTHAAALTMQSGTLGGGGITNTAIILGGGTVSSAITGKSSVDVQGDVTLSGKMDYTGATTVQSGTLTLGAAPTKSAITVGANGIIKTAGTLQTKGWALASGQALTLNGGKLDGSLTTVGKSTLTTTGTAHISGNLTLNGGTWVLGSDASVTVGGTLALNKATTLDLSSLGTGTHTILRYADVKGNWNNLDTVVVAGDTRTNYTLGKGATQLNVTVGTGSLALTWAGGNGTWAHKGGSNWTLPTNISSAKVFYNGDGVTFNSKGTVTINGAVTPSSVLVTGGGATTFAGKGSIAGASALTKNGTGTLKLNAVNTYTGGTSIDGGKLIATGTDSFGTGDITLTSGTLDFGKKAVENTIDASGGTITNGNSYRGRIKLSGALNVSGTLSASQIDFGTTPGVLSGGSINNAYITIGKLVASRTGSGTISSSLTGKSSVLSYGDLTLNGKHTHTGPTTASNGTLTVNGSITKSSVSVGSGSLILNGSILSNISLNGSQLVTPSKGLILAGGQTLSLKASTVSGNLTTAAKSVLDTTGNNTVTGDLTLNGGTWTLHKSSPLTVNGTFSVNKLTELDVIDLEAKNATYTIAKSANLQGWEKLSLGALGAGGRKSYELKASGQSLLLTISGSNTTLDWAGGKGKWELAGKQQWNGSTSDNRFFHGDSVVFDNAGTITLVGKLAPGAVDITSSGNVTFAGPGDITGKTALTMSGTGTLKLNATNSYTGDTVISAGKVVATGAASFGGSGITLNGGTLDLAKKAITNSITASGGSIANASAYNGALQIKGDVTVGANTHASFMQLLSGSLSGGSITNTVVYLYGGTMNSAITGNSKVTISGNATMTGNNTYTGDTIVNSGTLGLTGSISKSALISVAQGATLATLGHDLTLGSGQTLSLAGILNGNVATAAKSTLEAFSTSTIKGDLTLNGGTLRIKDNTAKVEGKLVIKKGTTIDLSELGKLWAGNLLTFTGVEGSWDDLSFVIAKDEKRRIGLITKSATSLSVGMGMGALDLTWSGGNGTWAHKGGSNWILPANYVSDKVFYNGDRVIFNSKGTITLKGEVKPASVLVTGGGSTTFVGKGSIAGGTTLTKTGTGTLKLNATNAYTGGTRIDGGKVVATGAASFGSGTISLTSGTLDLAKKVVANMITASNATIVNATAYKGDMTLSGAMTLGTGTHANKLTLTSGTLSGGSISNTALTLNGGTVNSAIAGGSVLNISGNVTLNAANTYTGATYLNAGTLTLGKAGSLGKGTVYLQGGILNLNRLAASNAIRVQSGVSTITGGSAYKGTVMLNNGTLDLVDSLSGTLVLNGGTLCFSADNLALGKVQTTSLTQINIQGLGLGDHTLCTFGKGSSIDLSLLESSNGTLSLQGSSLVLNVERLNSAAAEEEALAHESAEAVEAIDESAATEDAEEAAPAVLAAPALVDLAEAAAKTATRRPVAYKVNPALLGKNRADNYMRLVDGNRAGRYTGVMAALARSVDGTANAEEVKNMLDHIDGTLYTTQMGAQVDGNRAALASLRDMMGYGQPASGTGDYRFALQATSATSRMSGGDDAPGYKRQGFGGMVMAERILNEHAVAGLSVGYEHADVKADKLGKWESDDTRINAHLLLGAKGWQSRTIAGVGLHEYDMSRNVLGYHADSTPSGLSVNLMEEIARSIQLTESSVLEPFFRLESSYNKIGSVTESGSIGNAALELGKQHAWSTTLTFGARYVQEFTVGGALKPSRLMLEVGVSKEVGSQGDSVTARHLADSESYRLTPASRERWGAVLGGSVLIPVSENQAVHAGAKVQLRNGDTEVNANAGYMLSF